MVDANHDYAVSIVEDTLVWTFNNVLLVDSNTNEPGSHGFIRFQIDQPEGNSDYDEIKNKTFIFFDYNDPIITNEFTSIVHDDLTVNAIEINHNVKVYPNPTSGMLSIEGINSGTLSVSNVIGERVLFQELPVTTLETSTSKIFQLDYTCLLFHQRIKFQQLRLLRSSSFVEFNSFNYLQKIMFAKLKK